MMEFLFGLLSTLEFRLRLPNVRIAGTLEPELLEAFAQAVPAQAKLPEQLGLWKLLKKLSSQDTRRAMIAMICVLESLGKSLGTSERDRRSAKLFTKGYP